MFFTRLHSSMLHSTTVWLYRSLHTMKFALVSESDYFLLSSMVVSTVDLLVFKGVNDYENPSRYLQKLAAVTKQQSASTILSVVT